MDQEIASLVLFGKVQDLSNSDYDERVRACGVTRERWRALRLAERWEKNPPSPQGEELRPRKAPGWAAFDWGQGEG